MMFNIKLVVVSVIACCGRFLLFTYAFTPQFTLDKNHVRKHKDDNCSWRWSTTRSNRKVKFATVSETSEGSLPGSTSSTFNSITTTGNKLLPNIEAFSAGFHTPTNEVGCSTIKSDTTTIQGTIPSDLRGTFFKVGPAMFRAGSLPIPGRTTQQQDASSSNNNNIDESARYVSHPFDADGAIFALTFCNDNSGDIAYRYRFVRTLAFDRERKKRKRLYDSMDVTRTTSNLNKESKTFNDYPLPMIRHHFMPGLNKQRKNTSNTNVIYWANKLLSFWEGGLPYKMDGLALSTDGKSQLGGALGETTQLCSKVVIDSKKNRILMYALQQEPSSSILTTYEFDHRFKLVSGTQRDWKLPGYALINDGFACTDSWNIVIQPPIALNGLQYLINKDPSKCVSIDNSNPRTLLHLIPRGAEGTMITISIQPDELGPDLNPQIINAYEEDNVIVLDLIRSSSQGNASSSSSWQWPFMKTLDDYQSLASAKSLWRYQIDIKSRQLLSRECISCSNSLYFGSIHPKLSGQKHTYIYATAGASEGIVTPPQGIVKINCDTKEITSWMPQPHEFCGQPIFAPRYKESVEEIKTDFIEDDGYILTTLFNGETKSSELLILNANVAGTTSFEPIARIPVNDIKGGIPHGHYGWFASADTSDAGWSSDEIERRSKLADKMETKGNRWNEVKSDFSGLGLRLDDWEEYFGDIL